MTTGVGGNESINVLVTIPEGVGPEFEMPDNAPTPSVAVIGF
jgi:hypothetical protein